MHSGARRLAAIMFTDIVGYTSITQRDESHALQLLEEYRAVLGPVFAAFNGRVVKTIGDAFLVEFPSSLEAVECAVDIQQTLASRLTGSELRTRVGINLGDVVQSEGDIYGDAVNVASRVEQLAEPGGVCVSEPVYQSVLNKTSYRFEGLENQKMKNVENPVRVYRVSLGTSARPQTGATSPRDRIAVLPFVNISDGGGDGYFADGLTEELISTLSSIRGLRLIARTSVMAYRNSRKTASEIGTELGVGALVEGSVRRSGNRVRVAVQLVDASTQERLWGASYDRDLGDIFAVQSEIASKVAEVLPGHMTLKPGAARSISPGAYDVYLQARELMYEKSPQAVRKSLPLFKRAIELEPGFANAYVGLANLYIDMCSLNIAPFRMVEDAKKAAETAIQIDPDLAGAHATLGIIYWILDDDRASEREARTAVELNPSLSSGYESLAVVQSSLDRLDEAVKNQELAYRLDPLSSRVASNLSEYYFYAGRRDEAAGLWTKLLERYPLLGHQGFALDAIISGDLKGAGKHVGRMEELDPGGRNTLLYKGIIAGMRGDRTAAERVIEQVQKSFAEGAVTVDLIGFIRFSLGDIDAFFDCMLRAADTHVLWPLQLRYSPLFARVRGDPRMREAFMRAGLTLDAP